MYVMFMTRTDLDFGTRGVYIVYFQFSGTGVVAALQPVK